MRHVVIIGGGIAGLGAAYKIKRAQDAGAEVSFTVLEQQDRIGGQLWTDRVVDLEGQMIVADGGSDCYMTEKPALHRVAEMIDMATEETGTLDEVKKTFIVKNNKLVEMPDGIMMFAPTKIIPLATTSLYSWPAKFRMVLDFFMPKKKQPAGGLEDESVESLVTRRLGRECLDNLAEAIIGGVNGSDPKTMSVLATYPSLLQMEQDHGSLIRGFLAQRKKVEAMKKKYPSKPGQKRRTFMSSFKRGMGSFADALADAIGQDNIRLGAEVKSLERIDGSYRVTLESGEVMNGDAVICATAGWVASPLMKDFAASAAAILDTIPYSSCATVILAFDGHDAPFDKAWHGILTPAVEHRSVTGISLMSSKWEGRCPEGKVLLRGFIGGPRDPHMLDLTDEEIINLARKTYEELLGLVKDAPIRYAKVFRFPESMPQYTVGHLDRMKALHEIVDSLSGFALAGASYDGVGVPNCLESGEKAASKILDDFNIVLDGDGKPDTRIF
ncbi:MAG: protoporphyrinogen oxidase [Coriobacteriia bacterium]|nr:protoporphyrinogen oxidase [Coriobacteriia bacterium]